MSSFSEAHAHHDDLLPEHLEAVAERARAELTGAPERVTRAAYIMGLLHDAGKATPWFQDYLLEDGDESERTRHSLLGAVIAHRILSDARDRGEVSAWTHWAVVAGIERHHGNFREDLRTTLTSMKRRARRSDAIEDQLRALDHGGLRTWLDGVLGDETLDLQVPSLEPDAVLEGLAGFHPLVEDPITDVVDGFDFLGAFGAFVGADKMHAANPTFQREVPELPAQIVDRYKQQEFGEPDDELDEQREEIFAEVQKTLSNEGDGWIYTLTAPTGSGKTLTGLAAGLRLKDRKEAHAGDSRLVYCLPFTSVIDQNSARYEEVLTENDLPTDDRVLLKHHHLADPRYDDGGDEPIVDGSDLLVETWESEIVVTTFHQLLHTIFTSRNANLKRFAALRNAVVVLDEVQAIDHTYWNDIRRAMRLCAERLGTTFVLMTATMPLIVDPDETPELLESHPSRYEKLARTELAPRLDTPMNVEELAAEVRSSVEVGGEPRQLVIVNRRKTARRLYRELEDLPVATAMLSTDLTPLDRERVVDRLRLDDSESRDPFVLVSTQVVEAGMDISSDVVVREIAPLDSIIQSGGRCNREFELHPDRGRVEVVRLEEDGTSLAVPPYSSFLIESTKEVLDEFRGDGPIDEARFHEMARRYYEILQHRSTSASVTDLLADGDFHFLDDGDEGLRLIDHRPEQPHFIIQNEEDRRIWNTYLDIQNAEIRNRDDMLERENRFQGIKKAFSKRLVNYPADEETEDGVIPVEPEDGAYDPDTGLRRNLAEDSYAFI